MWKWCNRDNLHDDWVWGGLGTLRERMNRDLHTNQHARMRMEKMMKLASIFLLSLLLGCSEGVQTEEERYTASNCKKIAEWVDISLQQKSNNSITTADYPKMNIYDSSIAIYIARYMPFKKSDTYASAYINCKAIEAGQVEVTLNKHQKDGS